MKLNKQPRTRIINDPNKTRIYIPEKYTKGITLPTGKCRFIDAKTGYQLWATHNRPNNSNIEQHHYIWSATTSDGKPLPKKVLIELYALAGKTEADDFAKLPPSKQLPIKMTKSEEKKIDANIKQEHLKHPQQYLFVRQVHVKSSNPK